MAETLALIIASDIKKIPLKIKDACMVRILSNLILDLFCFGFSRSLYWTEWNRSIARIQKASMDGNGIAILFQNNLQRPYAISVDFIDQVLYWADAGLDRIESANVDGSNRRVVISSGLDEPYDLTLLGDMIYVSDTNLGILAANKSGAQPVEVIYSRFCEHVGPVGIQAVAQERQLFGE